MGGQDETAKLLLEKGAKVNVKDKDGWSPLRHAAVDGNKAMIKTLKSKGATVEFGDITKAMNAGKSGIAMSLMVGDIKMLLVIILVTALVIGIPVFFMIKGKRSED